MNGWCFLSDLISSKLLHKTSSAIFLKDDFKGMKNYRGIIGKSKLTGNKYTDTTQGKNEKH